MKTDISQQETQKVPVPPQVPTPPKGEVSGIIMLQPLPDGRALYQLNLNQLIAVSGMIPADIVRGFVADYEKLRKTNQAMIHAVHKLSH